MEEKFYQQEELRVERNFQRNKYVLDFVGRWEFLICFFQIILILNLSNILINKNGEWYEI